MSQRDNILNLVWDINTLTWVRMQQPIINGGSVTISGAIDTELPTAGVLGDGTTNPTTPLIGAAIEVYNGATWDRARGDITNGLDVDVTRSALPTGAATETTLGTRLAESTFTGRINTQGQKTMAASTPVVLASDQSAVPISAASLPLPSGAATEATLAVGGTNKTLKRAVVALAATGDVIAAVASKRLKVFQYALQSRNDSVTVQFRDGGAGSMLGLRWGLNSREGAGSGATDPARFIFATTAGNALQAVISGGTVDIEVSYWDDDAT